MSDSLSSLRQERQFHSNHLPEDFSFSSFASTPSEDEEDHHMVDLSEELDHKEFVPPISSVPVLADLLERQHECFDKAFLYLFDRALTITPTSPADDDYYDEAHNTVTSAIIMYNMGLVHHTRGMSRGKTKYLTKALQLYQMSLHMIQRVTGGVHDTSNDAAAETAITIPEVTVLILANLNNLAQIHSHLCLNDKMNAFIESMRVVLAECSTSGVDGGGGGNASGSAEFDDYSWFFTNILFFYNEKASVFAAAPAA